MKNGGPAFPKVGETGPGGQYIWPEDGMTLRDYFAAKAMQAFITSLPVLRWNGEKIETEAQLSIISYSVADAMIAERDKQ